jgi:hypothetical protein
MLASDFVVISLPRRGFVHQLPMIIGSLGTLFFDRLQNIAAVDAPYWSSEVSPGSEDKWFVFVATLMSPRVTAGWVLETRARWREWVGATGIAKAFLVCRAARRMVKQAQALI